MESSSTNDLSAVPTPNANLTHAHASSDKAVPHDQIQPSDSKSAGDGNPVGEKRKRDEKENDKEGADSADPKLHPLWKTSLCSYFRRQSGSCSHGDACRYAHGEEQLRPRPDNTWDPTSERAKKTMKPQNGGKRDEDEDKAVLMTEMVMEDNNDDDGHDNESETISDPALRKCLVHVPKKWHSDDLSKFLRDQGVQFKSAKKKKGMTVGFVAFEGSEQLEGATKLIDGKCVGNKNLKVADVIPRKCDKNIKSAMDSDARRDGNSDNVAVDGSAAKERNVRDAVTPLAHLPYSEQLEQKKNSIKQLLKKLTRNARKACPPGVSLPEWILKSKEIGGLACNLEGIIESPAIKGYRNKCEFSVGYSVQGKPTVGFMLGNFREGVTAVQEPVDCPNVSRIACKYASIFQAFLQTSTFPIWNRFKNSGFWRQLTVREGRHSRELMDVEDGESKIAEVMLIVQVCTSGFADVQIDAEFERLAQAFSKGAEESSPPLPLTLLVVQDHQGISNVAPADVPLRVLPIPLSDNQSKHEPTSDNVEELCIHDFINNLRFSISPTAFFQVNTLAAEKLYSLAGNWAGLGPDTLLFDICCGTGTIGLTLAHCVGMVIGIEMNASAVLDAHRNAEINGIKNCKFVCGKAEDVMGSLLKEYLDVSGIQDERPKVPDGGESACSTANEIMASADDASETEEKSSRQPENSETAARSWEDGEKEPQTEERKGCSLDVESAKPQFKNVVAIVDPPRSGLHPIVIKAIRTHPRLRRLVYISCNPETLVANAIELCTPSPDKIEKGKKGNRGWRNMSSAGLARQRAKSMPNSEPFRPIKAMAVDLFPHTHHCELVMLLER